MIRYSCRAFLSCIFRAHRRMLVSGAVRAQCIARGSNVFFKTFVKTAPVRATCIASIHTGRALRGHGAGPEMHGTTILCVRKGDKVVMVGDGQVTLGATVVKPNAKKVRRIGDDVMAGMAGSVADCFALIERLEQKLEEHPGQLTRACVDLAKAWRTDKYLRRLEASLIVADASVTFEITGNGDVLEPKDGVIAVGSGGTYALAAAKALLDNENMDAEQIARRAMEIAADICIYTNHNFVVEVLDTTKGKVLDQ